ncbi:MAG: hypothetical protein V1895_01725 [Parcubacteria group bacterium]
MHVKTNTLLQIVELGGLLVAGFSAGYLWPKAGPPVSVSRTPAQAELVLTYTGGQLSGTAPDQTTLTIDKDVIRQGEPFEAANAATLQWWSDAWAVKLNTIVGPESSQVNVEESDAPKQNFVASSSGTKYHPIEGCSFADRIKPENKIYFSTEQEAQAAGYEPSSCFTR